MELRIAPELEATLAAVAARTGRTVEQVAAAALTRGIEAEERFLKDVEQGIASADTGRLIGDEQVLAWLEEQEASERS